MQPWEKNVTVSVFDRTPEEVVCICVRSRMILANRKSVKEPETTKRRSVMATQRVNRKSVTVLQTSDRKSVTISSTTDRK